MPLTLNGTTGIAGVDGSAGTPAAQGSDTNTGTFYPAADTVAWATNGTERGRVSSDGTFRVKGAGTAGSTDALQISGSAPASAMTLDASGYLGIGTSSPTRRLTVIQDTQYQARIGASDASCYDIGRNGSDGLLYFYGTQSGFNGYVFGGVNGARARIDSSGNVYVEAGTFWQYQPAPSSFSASATLTAANVQTGIIGFTGSTASQVLTLPTGTALDTAFSGVSSVDIGFDFSLINTSSQTVTVAVGASGMTSLGTLTVATNVSARFRLRRTAANTYVLYRVS